MPAEDSRKQDHGHNICTGDPKVDHTDQDQETGTDQQCDHGSLADGTGGLTYDHVHDIDTLSCLQCCQRCSPSIGITGKIRHLGRERDQQKASGCQCRVHKVLTQTTEQHFYHKDGKHTAQCRHPQRNAHRQIQRQQQSRYHC